VNISELKIKAKVKGKKSGGGKPTIVVPVKGSIADPSAVWLQRGRGSKSGGPEGNKKTMQNAHYKIGSRMKRVAKGE